MSELSPSSPDRAPPMPYRVEVPRADQQWGFALGVAFDPALDLPDDMMTLLGKLDQNPPDLASY